MGKAEEGVDWAPYPTDAGDGGAGVSDELAAGQQGLKGQGLHEQRARHGLAVGPHQQGLHVEEGEPVDVVLAHPVAQRVQDLHRRGARHGYTRGTAG